VRLPEVGKPGSDLSVLEGGDVEPQTGRLLSVAELRRAMHLALAERPAAPTPVSAPAPRQALAPALAFVQDSTCLAVLLEQRPAVVPARSPSPLAEALGRTSETTPAPGPFVLVLAAQAGSGASTVALALSDAAAAAGREVQLVSGHARSTCGLLAVPHVELGSVEPQWRRGRRGDLVLVDRAGDDAPGSSWPQTPVPDAVLRVLDAPLGSPLASSAPSTVLLVCRATVPGLQRAEHALQRLEDQHRDPVGAGRLDPATPAPRVLLAVVGPDRWAGPVRASVGPRVVRLQRDGRVLTVPLDRHLDLLGPCPNSLPKAVLKAGRALLQHVEADLAHAAASFDARTQSWTTRPASVSPLDPRTSLDPKDRL